MNCSSGADFRDNTSLHISMAIQIVLSSLSIVANIFLIIMSKRYVFFHKNFKILVITQLLANIVHAVANAGSQIFHFIRLFSSTNNCDVLVQQSTCYYFLFPPLLCIALFVFIHGCMLLERIIAARLNGKYQFLGNKIGIGMVTAGFIMCPIGTTLRFKNYPTTGYVPLCLAVTKNTYSTMITGCILLSCLEIVFLATYFSLRCNNKSRLESTSYTLNQRFQLKENVLVLNLLGPLFLLTFIILVLFASLHLLLFVYLDGLVSRKVMLTFHGFAYVIPYYTLFCPMLIWIILTKYERKTRQAIAAQIHITKREERVMYFDTYNKLWR